MQSQVLRREQISPLHRTVVREGRYHKAGNLLDGQPMIANVKYDNSRSHVPLQKIENTGNTKEEEEAKISPSLCKTARQHRTAQKRKHEFFFQVERTARAADFLGSQPNVRRK